MIECVPDSKSRDQIGRQTDGKLYEYFLSIYGDETSPTYQLVLFIISILFFISNEH